MQILVRGRDYGGACEADAFFVSGVQDAADPAGEGHRHRVHQAGRVQVQSCKI